MTIRVATWTMNHGKRAVKRAWDFLRYVVAPDKTLIRKMSCRVVDNPGELSHLPVVAQFEV